MTPFHATGGALNITAAVASVAYKLPADGGPDVLLSHLGAVAGEHVYFKFGGSNVAVAVPAFDGTPSDDAAVLAAGSIQVRRPIAGAYIAVIAASDQQVSIETGLGA